IFTEYQATQTYLQVYLAQNNIRSVPFRGGMRRGRKDWLKHLFSEDIQVFIATEAGAEGINLQFCRYMINYDLPWNPMRLEQRIGRIHRYGQKSDVHIINLAIEATIEDHIVQTITDKVKIIEETVGELDFILTSAQEKKPNASQVVNDPVIAWEDNWEELDEAITTETYD